MINVVLPKNAENAAKVGGLYCVGWGVFSDHCYDSGPTTEKLCRSKVEAENYAREIKMTGKNYYIAPLYSTVMDPLRMSIF